MSEPVLPFTGERFTPECVREIAYEHWHRYAFARAFAKDRRVLDAACGEGFGSALLVPVAQSVLGVDIDVATVNHARSRYDLENLRFAQADATRLDDIPDASFDLIVSFETLEHVRDQERMLAGFARLLAPNGLLLVSTPDKHVYSEVAGTANPHHVRELYRGEFEALLVSQFRHHRLFGQKLAFVSLLSAIDIGKDAGSVLITQQDGSVIAPAFNHAPMYYVAACAQEPATLACLPDLALYSDAAGSVYADYYREIRANMAAVQLIKDLETEVLRLRAGSTP